MTKAIYQKLFFDKQGRLAIFEFPNAPIIVWALAAAASRIFSHGLPHKTFSIISLVAIIIWALLEIFLGVNYFRRALGLIVLGFTIYMRFFK